MQISYLGLSCFKIQGKNNGQEITILIDPFGAQPGLRAPRLNCDVLLFTRTAEKIKAGEGVFLIENPGEYEAHDSFIYGINAQGPKKEPIIIYAIEREELTLAHLGWFGQKELTDRQLERLGKVDILCLPVGGHELVDAAGAVHLLGQIEPKIVIPMLYSLPKIKAKLDNLDKFIKASGLKPERMPKFKASQKDLTDEKTKLVVLEI